MTLSHTGPPRRAFHHRLPVRLRHYWKPLAVACVGFVALVVIFGQARVRPYITSQLTNNDQITNNITGHGNLFDSGSHSISLRYNTSEYKDMMSTFRKQGEKEFIRADITIDGTVINDVGIRLKGNSTLSSLRGTNGQQMGPPQMGNKNGAGQPGQFPGGNGGQQPGDAGNNPPGDNAKTGDQNKQGGQKNESGGQQPGGQAGGGFGGMPMANLSEDKPDELPWLISFDEFSSGRAYQGNTEITLRPAALGSKTAINEALALTLTKQAGQTTQAYTITNVSVNGGKSVPRMLLDAPDESWADSRGDGVLYKARAGGSFDYQGDDPTDYTDAFDQINSQGGYDLEPVMKLLKFVSKSSDKEFGEQLDSYLDVDSFAQYLALQKLLSNSDAMDGPGNNYYLWYNSSTKRFTVLSWDLNLSFSGMSLGGAGRPGQGQQDKTQQPDQQGKQQGDNGQFPANGKFPGNGQQPPGGMPGNGQGGGNSKAGPGMAMGRGSGALKTRFMANDKFAKLYQRAYSKLYQKLYASGKADSDLSKIVARAKADGDTGTAKAAQQISQQLKKTSATSKS